jgi:hypothetical protein
VRKARFGGVEMTAAMAAAAATVGVLVAAARSSGPSQNLWRAYVLFLCFLAVICAVRVLRHAGDPGPVRGSQARATARSGLPDELTRVNDLLLAGLASRPDFERGMRPLLIEIAADRLLAKGIDLRRDPERAEAELGPETAALLLREGGVRASFQDRGPSRREISLVLTRMEQVGR